LPGAPPAASGRPPLPLFVFPSSSFPALFLSLESATTSLRRHGADSVPPSRIRISSCSRPVRVAFFLCGLRLSFSLANPQRMAPPRFWPLRRLLLCMPVGWLLKQKRIVGRLGRIGGVIPPSFFLRASFTLFPPLHIIF